MGGGPKRPPAAKILDFPGPAARGRFRGEEGREGFPPQGPRVGARPPPKRPGGGGKRQVDAV